MRKVVHIVKHTPTGAKVPMVINKTSESNIIENYQDYVVNRRGFTIEMIMCRWDRDREDVINILQEYQIPAHVKAADVGKLPEGSNPIDAAVIFEEYILAVEKKAKLAHNKLKSKRIARETEH
jgi:hypothetical protein